jgi:hypothetical protein
LPGWTDVDGDHCGTLVRYVDIDNHSSADGDGLTWSTAISAVQDGIDTCQTALQANANESHCEVWVAEGTYYIYQTALHNTVRLRTGVHVFGGFSGTETYRDQRDWTDHATTLDGHKNAGSSERVEHVVLCEQEGLIDGFVITGGYNQCDDVYRGAAECTIQLTANPSSEIRYSKTTGSIAISEVEYISVKTVHPSSLTALLTIMKPKPAEDCTPHEAPT